MFDSLEQEKGANRNPRYIFVVITSTKMKGVLDNYERSMLASRAYYNQLIQEGRLDVIDGPRILDILQQLYRKTHLLPTDVILTSYNGWLQAGAVRIGFVSGKEIVELHAKHGDALFFENIRDFLGVDDGKKTERTTVNQEISRTIHQDPARMLERNNGLTFRAASVEVVDEFRLVLKNGAIANGCQTTMCLVHAGKAAETCLIQTKIVETLNGWDVAHAANYQNPVARIDLDLARYLRPQIIQKAAIDAGFGGTEGIFNAANQVLSAVHQNRINYEETKALYLGIFSNSPRNLFERNYTEVRGDMLVQIYQIMGMDDIFATLFLVVGASREAGSRCRATFKGAEYASLFKRVYDDEKPNYRMYLAILALCGSLRVDISNKETGTEKEAMRIREFLTRSREMIENERGRYIINYVKAFHVVADYVMELPTEASIISNLHNKFVQTRFEVFYRKLLIKIDVDAALYEQP